MTRKPHITEGEISLKLLQATLYCLIQRGILNPNDLESIIAALRSEAPLKSASAAGSAADVATDWLLSIGDQPPHRSVRSVGNLPRGQNDD